MGCPCRAKSTEQARVGARPHYGCTAPAWGKPAPRHCQETPLCSKAPVLSAPSPWGALPFRWGFSFVFSFLLMFAPLGARGGRAASGAPCHPQGWGAAGGPLPVLPPLVLGVRVSPSARHPADTAGAWALPSQQRCFLHTRVFPGPSWFLPGFGQLSCQPPPRLRPVPAGGSS